MTLPRHTTKDHGESCRVQSEAEAGGSEKPRPELLWEFLWERWGRAGQQCRTGQVEYGRRSAPWGLSLCLAPNTGLISGGQESWLGLCEFDKGGPGGMGVGWFACERHAPGQAFTTPKNWLVREEQSPDRWQMPEHEENRRSEDRIHVIDLVMNGCQMDKSQNLRKHRRGFVRLKIQNPLQYQVGFDPAVQTTFSRTQIHPLYSAFPDRLHTDFPTTPLSVAQTALYLFRHLIFTGS